MRGSSTFAADGPLVADLANQIEALYPGHVQGVEVPFYDAAGIQLGDRDILLNNAVIQVKSGQTAGVLFEQLKASEATSYAYIYHPRLEDGNLDRRRIYLDYHSADLIKGILEIIGDNPELIIDNDFGVVLPGDQFVARLRSDPAWKWAL